MKSQTDWEHLGEAPDYEGEAEFEIDWSSAKLVEPEPKKLISLRIDADIVEFFRNQGRGYQTRMNAVLRAYKNAHEKS
ncbi:BrnA antitoxin family protein [Ruegeria pomeroyi]|uniref:BrnA antitoxin family protein n=1 Tax=Ruegeria pomeroyi TaxID=89184 RepID=UPI001F4297F8|nr:BrnA antitoxin family protein [Ruegeria pomeroyi]MCE8507287.1 BrnA antitoxin family protein [Ruegeria pomeroyi]